MCIVILIYSTIVIYIQFLQLRLILSVSTLAISILFGRLQSADGDKHIL